MTDTIVLHVKLGPVQTFIRQARRTRDLWAGSFLLSWLSGKAMVAAVKAGGKIILPTVAGDEMWEALKPRTDVSLVGGPTVATLPNHFTVDLQDGDGAEIGRRVSEAVACAWKLLADAVWAHFLDGIDGGISTRDIWKRQINGFWQVSWSVGDDAVFAGREHWRYPQSGRKEEGGDHCSIMGDYQELSGHARARGGGAEQDAFWDKVRISICKEIYRKAQPSGSLELGRSERLCAIALVKRLFPLLPLKTMQEIIGWIPVGAEVEKRVARKRLRKYPSTAYMAALPWLLKSRDYQPNGKAAVDDYLRFVKDMAKGTAQLIDPDLDLQEELETPEGREIVRLLTSAERHSRLGQPWVDFAEEYFDLDGTLFYENGIERRRAEIQANRDHDQIHKSDPDSEKGRQDDARKQREILEQREILAVEQLQKALAKLQTATAPDGGRRQRKMVKASPFYALLRMDGDHIGKELQKDKGERISSALTGFTRDAARILPQHYGLPIYVGGDDVLALLPLHKALPAAEALRRVFVKHMRANGCDIPTLSAGMVFAQYSTPLGTVLDLSKDLLEIDAKAKNGRDSLALSLLKGSGEVARFVTKWERSAKCSCKCDRHPPCVQSAVPMLTDLTVAFAQDDERSSSLIHNLQSRLADLFRDGTDGGLWGDDLIALLLAERMRGKDKTDRDQARVEMEQLAALCRTSQGAFRLDAALIAKFLADNGGWYGLPGMKP